MDNEELFKAFRTVALTAKPERTFFDDIRYTYQDGKITVSQILSGKSESINLKHIRVDIHSVSIDNTGSATVTSTRVYEYTPGDDYYRPGKWETYVIFLAAKIEEDKIALNGVPFDDSAIFPDI